MSLTLTRLGVEDNLSLFWKTLNAGFPLPPEAPGLNAWYPRRGTVQGDAEIVRRLKRKQKQKSDPKEVHYVLATIDGKPAGAVIWLVLEKPQSTDVRDYAGYEGVWEEDKEQRFAQELWESYIAPRRRWVEDSAKKGKDTWVLEWLSVLPIARKKGVGEALVLYGRDRADAEELECLTEGTAMGRPLYAKLGFENLGNIPFSVSEEFEGRPLPNLCAMRRVREQRSV